MAPPPSMRREQGNTLLTLLVYARADLLPESYGRGIRSRFDPVCLFDPIIMYVCTVSHVAQARVGEENFQFINMSMLKSHVQFSPFTPSVAWARHTRTGRIAPSIPLLHLQCCSRESPSLPPRATRPPPCLPRLPLILLRSDVPRPSELARAQSKLD